MKQPELYERFRALHEQKGGFLMPNAWDGASALILKQAGSLMSLAQTITKSRAE